ncbi:PAQR family membrane homeostasis protein TrhA [Polyangium sorediatum]|uniref:Hemolysin III family protein n=1 Tax=Polyangium sorediatum TaxID=889274 RepID=A0ABT6P740_9BACT|nr:hemolysin III family protein [Polyangium sorediatum]MDI1436439.1 hemolysin III family protein [Polyangium sorediatum]
MNDDLLASPANGFEPHSEKPRLRGVIHQWAAVVALVAGVALVCITAGMRRSVAAGVYSLSLLTLFSVSATYHRVNWSPQARLRMRRLDHAAIFVLIAGTYTPVALIALGPGDGTRLCTLAWACAAVGILKSVFWSGSPKWVTAAIAVAAGWCIVPFLSAVGRALDTTQFVLLFGGGIVYTAGALAYASRRPNPVVGVFGYHEVFHACTVIAAAMHFAAVVKIVRGA